jgi:hypothetical protein
MRCYHTTDDAGDAGNGQQSWRRPTPRRVKFAIAKKFTVRDAQTHSLTIMCHFDLMEHNAQPSRYSTRRRFLESLHANSLATCEVSLLPRAPRQLLHFRRSVPRSLQSYPTNTRLRRPTLRPLHSEPPQARCFQHNHSSPRLSIIDHT